MKIIGDVQKVQLQIFQGADLNFDIDWFEADGTTPIEMSDVASQIRESPGGEVVLDLTGYIRIDDDTPNVAHVSVPASVTAELPVMYRIPWDLNAIAAGSGEVKKMMRGTANIRAGITAEGSS